MHILVPPEAAGIDIGLFHGIGLSEACEVSTHTSFSGLKLFQNLNFNRTVWDFLEIKRNSLFYLFFF